ncbi:MAG: class F sortase [Chloroflexia bacterium]
MVRAGLPAGQPGNSVLAGHLDSTTGPAVFYKLDQIKVGDMPVVDKDNRSIQFRVTKSQVYYNDEAPLYEIFGPSDESHLNLITCDGAFDRNSKEYDRKLVVFSVLVS